MTSIPEPERQDLSKAEKEGEADRIYRLLKAGLIECKFSPGDVLSEVVLARQCNTSRTPIREACNRLAQDGWIIRIRYKGYLVAPVSIRDVLHLYDYRKLLECFARIAPEVVMKILLVEDEVRTAHYLRKGLVESGFAVDVLGSETAGGGPRHTDYDLLVCDMAPDSARASKIRCDRQQSPVLFLVDRHEGAERPASPGDLLYKPFAFADFLARVRFLLNSRRNLGAMTLRIADLDLDLLRHRATRDCMRLDLTPKEFLLLSLLIRRSGEVLSRAFIADQVWEINFDSCTNFVDVHIRRLRSKVDDPFPKHLIHTVRGMGYVLEDRERRPQSILPRRTVTDAFGSVNEAFGLP